MLQLIIPDLEIFNDSNNEFINIRGQTIQIEHSLVSISKWESKHNKPLLTKDDKTVKETIDYIRCMTITQNVRPEVYNNITNDNIKSVSEYISSPMTATTFHDINKVDVLE